MIRGSLALLTDLYQLTMAYAYWKEKIAGDQAVFHLSFRKEPFAGGYAVASGLAPVIDFLKAFRFTEDDLAYLATLKGSDNAALFDDGFLKYLGDMRLTLDVDAVLEGTAVFANEPLIRVRGPIMQAQILETALLNIMNFDTLIATKAARIVLAAEGEPVLEFGLRRAQGIDGGLAASRAAYIGGCVATSNVLAGKLYGIPVRGTHAHSWVMCFDDELDAFRAYADAAPNNVTFLVDTYDTLHGVDHAITVGKELRQRGHTLSGIRLDSGDLAWLSIEARKRLDAAGFTETKIVASNDLDEQVIRSLKEQGARINVWGVGTRLVTAFDQPALGAVYKLGAIKHGDKGWQPRIKVSDQTAKVSFPGTLQVRRYRVQNEFVGDVIYDAEIGIGDEPLMIDPHDPTRRKKLPKSTEAEDLLVPIMRNGEVVHKPAKLEESRARTVAQLGLFHGGVKRNLNPHRYPVGLESRLHEQRTRLIIEAREKASS
jgi:nicotinate phosphoribosyltransferase